MVDTARGPFVIRRRLGAALKRHRIRSGMHLDVVAKELEVSPAKLSRLETGQVAPKLRDVRDLLALYEVGAAEREKLMDWTDDARDQGWWQPFTADVPADLNLFFSLEAEAHLVQGYSHSVFAGLLQTEGYAEMVLRGAAPQSSEEQLRQLVSMRLRRSAALSRDPDAGADAPPLRLHSIFHESALHSGPAEGSIMIDQFKHLLRQSMRPTITVQMFPFAEGFSQGSSPFAIFVPRLDEDGVVVNVESVDSDAYYDTEAAVARYQRIWRSIADRSLSTRATRDAIRAALRERGGDD